MGAKVVDSYVFTALEDFTAYEDEHARRLSALEYGIRIIDFKNISNRDWRVIKGPFWSFRRKAKALLFGYDKEDSFYIRKLEAERGSNIRLFYYNVHTGEEAIIEIDRKPGLCLTFRTGFRPSKRCDVISRCTHEYMLRFITHENCYDIL